MIWNIIATALLLTGIGLSYRQYTEILGKEIVVGRVTAHSTCLYERTMIAFGPRCPSGDLNKQEEDEEKGTFKPME
ncbi:MAG: hypothetical protein NTZ78_15120 [Candidatus Aureabacteria bacterium]|nr:hypothetical protein [Candidatus Auribacterota bacterium]